MGKSILLCAGSVPALTRSQSNLQKSLGARGSSQPLCRLSVRMKRLGSFASESVEDEVMIAVSRAAERAAKQAQRILDRQRDETRR